MVRHLLEKWMSHAMVYRVLHHTASEDYDTSNTFYKIPAIVITAISAGLAFSVQVFPEETSLYVPVLVGMLNLTAGVFTTITNFKKLPELSEANKIAAVNFSKLHRKIKQKLTLCREEKISDEFVNSIREDLDNLIESSPPIRQNIIKAFSNKHKNKREIQLPTIVKLGGLEVIHSRTRSRNLKKEEKEIATVEINEIKIDSIKK